jgi:hypothetical protein
MARWSDVLVMMVWQGWLVGFDRGDHHDDDRLLFGGLIVVVYGFSLIRNEITILLFTSCLLLSRAVHVCLGDVMLS